MILDTFTIGGVVVTVVLVAATIALIRGCCKGD